MVIFQEASELSLLLSTDRRRLTKCLFKVSHELQQAFCSSLGGVPFLSSPPHGCFLYSTSFFSHYRSCLPLAWSHVSKAWGAGNLLQPPLPHPFHPLLSQPVSSLNLLPDSCRCFLWYQRQQSAVSWNLSQFRKVSPSVNVCLSAEGDLKFVFFASTLFLLFPLSCLAGLVFLSSSELWRDSAHLFLVALISFLHHDCQNVARLFNLPRVTQII